MSKDSSSISYVFATIRITPIAVLILGSIALADTFNSATGGGAGVTTSSATTKVGIGLEGTTSSNFPLAPQKLTIGVSGGATENVFGQFAAPGTFPGTNKLRYGAGDGTGITDWSGMEVLMNWTGATAHTSQLGFFTGSGTSSSQRLTILSNGNVGIGNPNPSSLLTVNGTVGITGGITLSSFLEFSTDASGGPGRLWKSSGSGLVLEGITGTTYDFTLLNPLAQPLLRNPTGTQSVEFAGAVTMPSNATVGGNISASRTLAINTAAGYVRDLEYQTGGVTRWVARADGTPESGSDAGSAYTIRAYSDAGTPIDYPMTITRAAGGAINLARPLTLSASLGFTTDASGGPGRLWKSYGSGLVLEGITGTTYDFTLLNPLAQPLLRNPKGTQSLEVPGILTTNSDLVIDKPAGAVRDLIWKSGGELRWIARVNQTAETGANAGSDWVLGARADNGAGIDNPITITRAAGGPITLARPVSISSAVNVTGGDLTIGSNSTPNEINLNGPNGQNRGMDWKTGGVMRWRIVANNTAETGANSGSDLAILSYNDAGSFLATALKITRSDRTFAIQDNATVGGSATVSGSIASYSTTAFIQDGPANVARDAFNLRTAGVNRWIIRNSAATEFGGGTNSGSSFQLIARADNGALIDNVIDITRAAGGVMSISRPMAVGGNLGIWNIPVATSAALSVKATQPWETNYDNTMELIGSVVNNPTIRFRSTSSATNSAWISAPQGGGMEIGYELDANPANHKRSIVITPGAHVALASDAGTQVIVGSQNFNPTPGVKLDVEGDARVSGALIARTFNASEGGSWGNMAVGNTDGIPGFYLGYKWTPNAEVSGPALSQTNDGTTTVNGVGASPVKLSVDGTAKVTVDPALVTVATNMTVNGDLSVGTVKARNWEVTEAPDYVFEKDYPLASLEKVESFVKKNQHLPEVPSAKQMKADGLDLVKMNFHLLKKVEELTLYAIEQEKRAKAQENHDRELQKEVRQLQKSLLALSKARK